MDWLGGFNMANPLNGGAFGGRKFIYSYKCHSAACYETSDPGRINEVNYGGKVLLPASCLDQLIRHDVPYPLLFRLRNLENPGTVTHCGVLEFSAPEGFIFVPRWIMEQLHIQEGQNIQVESIQLPSATYAKLKPQSTDFLSISNPRAVLEVELRKWACLSKNDRIQVRYNDQILEFLVQELKPADAVCIFECDINLDFDAPEGYVEESTKKAGRTEKPPPPPIEADEVPALNTFTAFQGSGARLDGKVRKGGRTESTSSLGALVGEGAAGGLPLQMPPVRCRDDYIPGTISFPRYDYKNRVVREKELEEARAAAKGAVAATVTFDGSGHRLRI